MNKELKIIHFSDPHAGGKAEDWLAYIDKRAVGVFNYRWRRCYQHDLSKLESAVKYILEVKPDVAVCSGDLTSTGQPREFAEVREILRPLRDSEIPLIYLPGNHDIYVPRQKCVRALEETFFYLNQERFELSGLPQTLSLGGADFVLVNTAMSSNLLCSWGYLPRQSRRFVADYCRDNPERRPKILVSHYPMFIGNSIWRLRHSLLGGGAVRRLLMSGKLDFSLCGHVHKENFYPTGTGGRGENCSGSVTKNGTMTEITYNFLSSNFERKTIEV